MSALLRPFWFCGIPQPRICEILPANAHHIPLPRGAQAFLKTFARLICKVWFNTPQLAAGSLIILLTETYARCEAAALSARSAKRSRLRRFRLFSPLFIRMAGAECEARQNAEFWKGPRRAFCLPGSARRFSML